jgi:hypothetical protein
MIVPVGMQEVVATADPTVARDAKTGCMIAWKMI